MGADSIDLVPTSSAQIALTYGSGHVHGVLWNGQEIASFERDNLHREVSCTLGNQLAATQQYD